MSKTIGTGEHAKTNVLWLVIKYSFLTGVGGSVVYALGVWGDFVIFATDDFLALWGVFTPLITLALGYLMGRGGAIEIEKNR